MHHAAHAPSKPVTFVKVPRQSLQSTTDEGIRKRGRLSRLFSRLATVRIPVLSAPAGVSDSVFFVPETSSADVTHSRATCTQLIKIDPSKHDDVVRTTDDFQVSFIGMSVTQQDMFGDNELLLCSLKKAEDIGYMTKNGMSKKRNKQGSRSALKNIVPSFTVADDDIPFIHYGPVVDGHTVGSKPNSFVSIPASKRLYIQRKGSPFFQESNRQLFVRFSVMEVDRISDEQLIALRRIEDIQKSFQTAGMALPYLMIISWVLKFAKFCGKVAMKHTCTPGHILSKDVGFLLADEESCCSPAHNCDFHCASRKRSQNVYGNYLRVSQF